MNTLPTNWCIEATEENFAELYPWWRANASESWKSFSIGHTLMSSHRDGSCYYANRIEICRMYNPEHQPITIEQFRQITNQTQKPMNTLPTKWYIEVTEENQEELNRWRKKVATQYRDHTVRVGHTLLSRHQDDGSYYYTGTPKNVRASGDYDDYQEITLEQFRQIINSTPTPNPMKKSIQISRELLNVYYEASTREQKAYLAEHFKLDGTTTDEAIRGLHNLACNKWKPRIKKNHPDCFPEDSKHFDFSGHVEKNGYVSVIPEDAAESLGLNHNFIRVRHNPKNEKTHCRSFYLDSDYNWELVQDGEEDGYVVMALIPTKKQS